MPRKPNYKFERAERDRQKAAKKAARREAKLEKAAEKKQAAPEVASQDGLAPPDSDESTD